MDEFTKSHTTEGKTMTEAQALERIYQHVLAGHLQEAMLLALKLEHFRKGSA